MVIDGCIGVPRTAGVDLERGVQLRQVFAVYDGEHVERGLPEIHVRQTCWSVSHRMN